MSKHFFYWLAVCISLVLPAATAQAQAPAWQQAQPLPYTPGSSCHIVAATSDAQGNYYLVGDIIGTVFFGTTTLQCVSYEDVFVAKWNPSTGFTWALQGGSAFRENVTGITLGAGGIYVTGTFGSDSAQFGGTWLHNRTHDNVTKDVFVAKVADAGTSASWIWAYSAGGNDYDDANAIAVSGNHVFIGGAFIGNTAAFGPFVLTNTSTNAKDVYVAKLSDTGNRATWNWAQPAIGNLHDQVTSLAASDSTIYVVGVTNSSTLRFGITTLTNAGNQDVFVAKLHDYGQSSYWQWAIQGGYNGNETPTGMMLTNGALYLTGYYEWSDSRFGTFSLPNAGRASDIFVCKVNLTRTSGSWAWAQSAGSNLPMETVGIVARGSDSYVTGTFFSNAGFGNDTLRALGNKDIFIAHLIDHTNMGSWDWSQQGGGSGADLAYTISLQGNELMMAGYATGPSTFGSFTLSDDSYFLAALTDPALGTEAELNSPTFTLAPNPARTTARLSGAAPGTRFTLFDGLGRTVLTATTDTTGTATLDVRALNAGLYLVRAEGQSGARRLVVE